MSGPRRQVEGPCLRLFHGDLYRECRNGPETEDGMGKEPHTTLGEGAAEPPRV